MDVPKWKRRHELVVMLLLVAVTVLLYVRVVTHEFVDFDDDVYITENYWVRQGLTVEGALWAFTTFHGANWHPLTWLSHMTDVSLFGLAPAGHHLMNAVFHAANAVLLFWVMRRLTGCLWRSALVAALFAWHPLHVESVAWAAERKDTLSTLFWLLTMLAYAGYCRRAGGLRYAAVLGAFTLGLLAKTMLITLPCVLLLLDYWPLGRLERDGRMDWPRVGKAVLEKLPLFALAVAVSVATFLAQRYGGAVGSFEKFSLYARVANGLTAYLTYLVKFVWPAPLAVFYPHAGGSMAPAAACAALFVLIVIGVAVWAARKHYPFLAVGWFWYLGTLVPVIGIVQVGDQALADRYTYVTQIGLYIMLAWGLAAGAGTSQRRQYVATALSIMALTAFAVRSTTHLATWRDSITLFTHAAQSTDGGKLAHLKLGNLYRGRGEREAAIREYERALAIDPGYAEAHNNLGILYLEAKVRDEAEAHFRSALELAPKHVQAHVNLGILLAEVGDPEAAVSHFERALAYAPNGADAHLNLGLLEYRRGNVAAGIERVRHAVELRPCDVYARVSLGIMLEAAEYLDQLP